MSVTSLLANKKCIPCQGGRPPMAKKEAHTFLSQLQDNWQINNAGHLYKAYYFKDFKEAMDFANKIAIIAEQEAHHPDLAISWGTCAIEIWTHKIDGLSESDFILAAKIDTIV